MSNLTNPSGTRGYFFEYDEIIYIVPQINTSRQYRKNIYKISLNYIILQKI